MSLRSAENLGDARQTAKCGTIENPLVVLRKLARREIGRWRCFFIVAFVFGPRLCSFMIFRFTGRPHNSTHHLSVFVFDLYTATSNLPHECIMKVFVRYPQVFCFLL